MVIIGGRGYDNGEKSPKSGKGRLLFEAAAGATLDASPEARWLAERLRGGKKLISGLGRRGLTIYYACPGQGGGAGCCHTMSVAKADEKREVFANSEEVK